MQTLSTTQQATGLYNNKMQCLVKEDINTNGLSFKTDYPLPAVGFSEVKIKVLTSAVCGTDKSIYNSANSEGIRREMQRYSSKSRAYHPIVIGHEFCGVVEEIGPGIEFSNVPSHLRIEKGDYVTAEMHLSCGHCLLCRTGAEHICTSVKVKGVHLDGCFANYVTVPYKNVILLGKGGDLSTIPPHIGTLLDAFGNAVHTVQEASVTGRSVAILGAGPLGLMSTFLCKTFGASRIYVTESADIERRQKLASEFGANYFIDVSKDSRELHKLVTQFESNANGVDVVLEMSGAPSAYNDAFSIVRNGGSVVLLGIAREPLPNFDIANGIIWKGVSVQGIFGRKMFGTWETMLNLIKSDKLDIQSKLTSLIAPKFYKLEEYKDAFDALNAGSALKLIFTANS